LGCFLALESKNILPCSDQKLGRHKDCSVINNELPYFLLSNKCDTFINRSLFKNPTKQMSNHWITSFYGLCYNNVDLFENKLFHFSILPFYNVNCILFHCCFVYFTTKLKINYLNTLPPRYL
jgi:hypothetical protein